MPELPEVEAVARALRPLVRGQRIRCLHVFHAIALKPQLPAAAARIVEGRSVREVFRRGKYLFLALDRGLVEMHFRFDGQLVWFMGAKELLERANAADDGIHVDVALEFGKGVLGFADRRHFGRVHVWESEEACPPLKQFLLDQTRIAGIGNIYSSEALWHARLNPWRRADSLDRKKSAKLHKAIVYVLRRALECCEDPAPDFHDPKWWFQGLEEILRTYQREGLPCRRSGRTVERAEQRGRSKYFYTQWQKDACQ